MNYSELTAAQKTEAQRLALGFVLDELNRYVANPALVPPPGAVPVVDAVRQRSITVAQGRDYLAPATSGDDSTVWLNTPDDQP